MRRARTDTLPEWLPDHGADLSGLPGNGHRDPGPLQELQGRRRDLQQHKLKVEVPAGVEEGTRMVFSGAGDAGVHGGPPGDALCRAARQGACRLRARGQRPSLRRSRFLRAGGVGGGNQIPTLEGDATIKLAEGTQSGTSFRLRHKGVPVLNGSGRGDLYVQVKVHTPAKLTKRQRELLQELESISGSRTRSRSARC